MLQALDTAGTRAAGSTPRATSGTDAVYAQRGDRLQDLAERHGVDAAALQAANPGLAQAEALLPGQPVRLPEHRDDTSPAVAGVSAATGREGLVQALQTRAYEAGRTAPQTAFDGTVLRAVPTAYERGALDHNFGGPGRSNARGQGMIYTAPDASALLRENAAYAEAGHHPLENKSVVALRYTATPDGSGRGGVADMAEGARRQHLPERALVEPKGGGTPGWLHQLTGEHPYTLPQQAGKGASDAGASALRAPAAVGGEQIDIVTRNTTPGQLTPQTVTRHDAHGQVTATRPAAGAIDAMPPDARRHVDGPLNKQAGGRPPIDELPDGTRRFAATDAPGRPLAAANEGLKRPAETPAARARQALTGATEGYPRAASTRYGAVGGAAATLVDAGVRAARGESVQAGAVAQAAAGHAALGGAAAKGVDLLTPRVGLVKAGGAVGALVQAGVSGYGNAQAYRAGQITGARAVANTVVDTGTAAAAGAAGAWVGAAVGSVVPVAGTAVGAVVGFGVGVGAHYAIGALDRATGVTQAAKDTLTAGLQSAQDGVSKAWQAIKPW